MSMQPEAPSPENHDDKGLPTVTPPSGKFIAQLFLIPGLIVVGVVGVIWFVTWLVGGMYTPESFLQDLRNPNPEIRWRRASDLAQVLPRDDRLAANPMFALGMTEILLDAVEDSPRVERAGAERAKNKSHTMDPVQSRTDPYPGDILTEEQTGAEDPTLRHERNFLRYLIACSGHLAVPVCVPVLSEIATSAPEGVPKDVNLRRRRLAVFALANLGENAKRFDRLSAPDRDKVLAELQDEIDKSGPRRREWAKDGLKFLQARKAGKPIALGVGKTLTTCAEDEDSMLRLFAAMALSFWPGTPEQNEAMEETLLKLSRDDGHGADQDQPKRALEIRFQAARALAQRGSKQTPIDLLAEMLDRDRLEQQFRVTIDGQDAVDVMLIDRILVNGLKSVAALREQQQDLDLAELKPAVEKLAQSGNPPIRAEAERALLAMKS